MTDWKWEDECFILHFPNTGFVTLRLIKCNPQNDQTSQWELTGHLKVNNSLNAIDFSQTLYAPDTKTAKKKAENYTHSYCMDVKEKMNQIQRYL